MKISNEALSEFIAIYKEEYGDELSPSEASEMTHRLLTLYELLMDKLPNEQTPVPKPLEHDRHS